MVIPSFLWLDLIIHCPLMWWRKQHSATQLYRARWARLWWEKLQVVITIDEYILSRGVDHVHNEMRRWIKGFLLYITFFDFQTLPLPSSFFPSLSLCNASCSCGFRLWHTWWWNKSVCTSPSLPSNSLIDSHLLCMCCPIFINNRRHLTISKSL